MQDSRSAPLRNIYNIRYRCPPVNPRPPHEGIKSPIFAHDGAKPPIIRPAEVARGLMPPVRAGGWGGAKIKIKISHFCNTSPRTFVTKLDYSNTCKRHPFFFILSSIPQGRGGNAPARFLRFGTRGDGPSHRHRNRAKSSLPPAKINKEETIQ